MGKMAEGRLNGDDIGPLAVLRRVTASDILGLIEDEHPQLIALILLYMAAPEAGAVLSGLAPALQFEVARRIAVIQSPAPEILEQLEEILGDKFSSGKFATSHGASVKPGGVESLAELIRYVDRETETNILDRFSRMEPFIMRRLSVASFLFGDLAKLDAYSMQRALEEVNELDLAIALNGAANDLKSRVFSYLSAEAIQRLETAMDSLGPISDCEVDEAQQRILNGINVLKDG